MFGHDTPNGFARHGQVLLLRKTMGTTKQAVLQRVTVYSSYAELLP